MLRRKSIIFLVLSSYLVLMSSYLRPILSYKINFDYIVEFLCEQKDEEVNRCNGSCHLSKEIIDELTNKNSEGEEKAFISNVEQLTPHYFASDEFCPQLFLSELQFIPTENILNTRFSEPLTPPPKRIT